MKKILMMLVLCTMAVCGANAQKVGVWYGMNAAMPGGDLGDLVDSEMKFLNLGVDYTAPINEAFDWSAGLAYVTKGGDGWDPSYIQVDANARWNFWTDNDIYKLSLLFGPYFGYMVGDDDAEGTKEFDCGLGVGVQGMYQNVFLRVGYEYGFTDCLEGGSSNLGGVYVRVGYAF